MTTLSYKERRQEIYTTNNILETLFLDSLWCRVVGREKLRIELW